jgi:hypothetical protein
MARLQRIQNWETGTQRPEHKIALLRTETPNPGKMLSLNNTLHNRSNAQLSRSNAQPSRNNVPLSRNSVLPSRNGSHALNQAGLLIRKKVKIKRI